VHFVQMWVLPDTERIEPGYQQLDIGADLAGGGWVPVASGRGHEAAITIRQRDAALYAARPNAGASLALPAARYVHLYVARGSVTLEGVGGTNTAQAGTGQAAAGELRDGDAARITGADGPRVTAGPEGAELLVWEMHSSMG